MSFIILALFSSFTMATEVPKPLPDDRAFLQEYVRAASSKIEIYKGEHDYSILVFPRDTQITFNGITASFSLDENIFACDKKKCHQIPKHPGGNGLYNPSKSKIKLFDNVLRLSKREVALVPQNENSRFDLKCGPSDLMTFKKVRFKPTDFPKEFVPLPRVYSLRRSHVLEGKIDGVPTVIVMAPQVFRYSSSLTEPKVDPSWIIFKGRPGDVDEKLPVESFFQVLGPMTKSLSFKGGYIKWEGALKYAVPDGEYHYYVNELKKHIVFKKTTKKGKAFLRLIGKENINYSNAKNLPSICRQFNMHQLQTPKPIRGPKKTKATR